MSVRVRFIGRLGNNLFQYAIGRIVAEHLGLALICERIGPPEPPLSFLGQTLDPGPSVTFEQLAGHFPNAPLSLPGDCVSFPSERYELGCHSNWKGQTIDLRSILANSTRRQICMAGYFQRMEYFAPFSDQIKNWFTFTPTVTPFDIRPNDVLVNFRRSIEYAFYENTLSFSYYKKALGMLQDRGKVYVCGTGIDKNIRNLLANYEPIYYDASPIEHLSFITRFKRIILSNSTFAWWAGYLSNATELYAPRLPSGTGYSFSGYEDIDLHLRETRYIEVEGANIARFAPFTLSSELKTQIENPSFDPLASPAVSSALVDLSNQSRQTCRLLLQYMAKCNGPITLYDARQLFGGTELYKLFARLVNSGALNTNIDSYIDT